MDFFFQNVHLKTSQGRNKDFLWLVMVMSALINVTQQILFETVVVIFQKHLLPYQIKFKKFMKKILTGYSEFCNILLYFMICYYCHVVSPIKLIFSMCYLPFFMYEQMRR